LEKRYGMPDVTFLIIVAVMVVSAVLLFKLVKGIMQGLLLGGITVVVIIAISGGLIAKDVMDIQKNLNEEQNILLFSDSNKESIVSGVIVKGLEGFTGTSSTNEVSDEIISLSEEKIQELDSYFATKNYAAMLGDNYKLIIVNEAILSESLATNKSLTEDLNIDVSKIDVKASLNYVEGSQKALSQVALLSLLTEGNPLLPISEYKKGNIIVYPETTVFKIVKLFPTSLIKKTGARIFSEVGDIPDKVNKKLNEE
jgi:hypothetical protein